jgi:putative membrane protein
MGSKASAFAWLGILGAYAAMFGVLAVGGALDRFLHPRMHGFAWFAAALLPLLAGVQLVNVLRGTARLEGGGLLLFVLPLVFIPAASLSSAATALGDAEAFAPTGTSQLGDAVGGEWEIPNAGVSMQDWEQISADNETFYPIMLELYGNSEAYLGKAISLKGFLRREESWPEDRYLLARMAMWCCAADASPVGLLFDQRIPLVNPDAWYEIRGTVTLLEHFNEYTGLTEPVPGIAVEAILETKAEEVPFIFAY